MKNYDETISAVFERMDEFEKIKVRKRKLAIKTLIPITCLCIAVLIGVFVWQNQNVKPSNTSDSSAISSNKSTLNGIPDGPIIWNESVGVQPNSGCVNFKEKTLTFSLYSVLLDQNNKDNLIAVSVGLEVDKNFIYNGKSLADYNADADAERFTLNKMDTLQKVGDDLKYGEALYLTGNASGVKWAKSFYDETLEYYGEKLLSKYIVDGEFLKEQLIADRKELSQNTPCQTAYETAYKAAYQHAIDQACKHLEEQNIRYERGTGLVIFVTADEFDALTLENVRGYGLANKVDKVDIAYDNIY